MPLAEYRSISCDGKGVPALAATALFDDVLTIGLQQDCTA